MAIPLRGIRRRTWPSSSVVAVPSAGCNWSGPDDGNKNYEN